MAYTQEDLDAVRAAKASGEEEISFADGRRVRYRSIDELTKAEADIQRELNATNNRRSVKFYRIRPSSGF